MKRSDLEHIIRAAADLADDEEVVVLGSQAILGQFPAAPPELLQSQDADVYPRNHPVQSANTRGARGLCLEVHDLLVSKYVAGREKDLEFARTVIRHGLVDPSTLLRRIEETSLDPDRRELVETRARRDLGE